VADLPAESFEVTRLDEMIPARADHTMTIKPSDWSERAESAPVGPPMWKPTDGEPTLTVSEQNEEGGEVISELWRLAAERPPAPPENAPDAIGAEAPQLPAEAEASALDGYEAQAGPLHDPEPQANNGDSRPRWAEPAESMVPPVDSPENATQVLSREEVSNALGIDSETSQQDFELGEPGTGIEPDSFGVDRAAQAETGMSASGETLELDLPMRPSPPDVFPHAKMEDVSFGGGMPSSESDMDPDASVAVPAPPLDEPASPVETAAIPRQVIEEALRGPEAWQETGSFTPPEAEPSFSPSPEPATETVPEHFPEVVPESADLPSWTPPDDLDHRIARFNSKHKLVYRMIRSEVGAGAANFVKSCRSALPEGDLFGKSELKSDGTFEADGLRMAVVEGRIADPSADFERMIEREVESLRALAGEARVRALVEQLRQL
jgi:hypothetical protein